MSIRDHKNNEIPTKTVYFVNNKKYNASYLAYS